MFHSAITDDLKGAIDTPPLTAANDAEDKLPPAVLVPLQGHYLIEASAGTGKTWTLTGIVLRLLIEARRAPEHIIATTFTRAAAAEMRERINARLKDFYQLLLWLNKLQDSDSAHNLLFLHIAHPLDASKAQIQNFKNKRQSWLESEAKRSGFDALFGDPINNHLIIFLLDNVTTYPLMDAIRRCRLVLTTLDKLFVGTLDSLAQKWLSEFSAETGYQSGIKISENEQIEIDNIIHDYVRGYQSHLYGNFPEIYKLFEHSGKMISPSDYKDTAARALQFFSTPIEPIQIDNTLDLNTFADLVTKFSSLELTEIEPYFDQDYRKAKGFSARGKFYTNFEAVKQIQAAAKQFGMTFFYHLDDTATAVYQKIPEVFAGKLFNKPNQAEREAFCQIEFIQVLNQLAEMSADIETYLEQLKAKLNFDIAQSVRRRLPAILETRRETTFALQMVRLNQALTGTHGNQLARYIRHHYPVALIDESQDINGEQAQMLERIYLQKEKDDKGNIKPNKKGFLLLVGDPKQAIYGFRGGDVANYNAMKRHFSDTQRMSLDINRRSNERLITALNHWFGRPSPDLKIGDSACFDALAGLGQEIFYHHISAANKDIKLSWQQVPSSINFNQQNVSTQTLLSSHPVSIIHLPSQPEPQNGATFSEFELTAIHIAQLLKSGQTIENRLISPSDIGVLGRTKDDLRQVERMLNKIGIPTFETSEVNVFDTVIAADLLALLEAMLRPQKRDVVNRVLTSHFYQLSLLDVQTMMQSLEQSEAVAQDKRALELKKRYQQFQEYLKTAAAHWQNGGILSALHFALGQQPFADKNKDERQAAESLEQSVWENLATLPDGARYLIDLRHLLDILAQFGMHIGEFELLTWFKKHIGIKNIPDWAQQQPMPTDSGVQLMTIHKSKGLEFPIVYVIGMGAASKKAGNKTTLYLFDDETITDEHSSKRRLSASAGKFSKSAKGDKDDLSEYYAQFETQENYEERRRLAYVAFTRASEQLYIVLQDASTRRDIERKPLNAWLDCDDKEFSLPSRLAPVVGWVNYDVIAEHAQAVMTRQKSDAKRQNAPKKEPEPDYFRIDYNDAYHQIKAQVFKGWAKTSFTALSRQLSAQSQALAVVDDVIEDELDLTNSLSEIYLNANVSPENQQIMSDDIRFRFVKGANAGTFLHKIFEKIDFQQPQNWSKIIDQNVRQHQLPVIYTSGDNQWQLLKLEKQQQLAKKQAEQPPNTMPVVEEIIEPSEDELEALALNHNAMIRWIDDVLKAPLLASGQPLCQIDAHQRMAEMSFNMGLSEVFTPEKISAIFEKHLPDEPDKHIQLTAQSAEHIYRYLRGEIDLVYEFAGKYFVVDYKSNYLGDSLSHYDDTHLKLAMNKAGYWLQAAIYQVALHRFLKLRLKDYVGNEIKYLGAVEYVFLRGIAPSGVEAAANYGRIQWQIPFELIQELDEEAFGTPTN